MSRVPGLKITDPMIMVMPKADAVARTLGAVTPLLTGAIRVRIFDLLNHHRSSVGKASGVDFPGKRHSQKFIFARYYRYTQSKVNPARPLDVVGKGWMGAKTDERFWDFEFGRHITAKSGMVMPIGHGLVDYSRFWKLLEEKKLTAVPRPGKPPLLVQMINRTSRAQSDTNGEVKGQRRGARMIIWGIIGRVRHQTRLLKFREKWGYVEEIHLNKFDRMLDRMLTEAGRQIVGFEVAQLAGIQNGDTFARRLKKIGDPSSKDNFRLKYWGEKIAKEDNQPKESV